MFFEYPKLLWLELLLIPLVALYVFRELKGRAPALPWTKTGKSRIFDSGCFVRQSLMISTIPSFTSSGLQGLLFMLFVPIISMNTFAV